MKVIYCITALWILLYAESISAMRGRRRNNAQSQQDTALYDPNTFEGDILISQDEIQKFYGDSPGKKPRGEEGEHGRPHHLKARISLWPNGAVYYKFDKTNDEMIAAILQVMKTIEELVPCVNFLPRTNGKDFVTFRSKTNGGCASNVGHHGGEQVIMLGPMCNTSHILLHEICHALGLWHEHTRPDRDRYVQVLDTNIQNTHNRNFMKRNTHYFDSHGQQYDFASVMHYHLNAFAKEVGLNTLKITKQGRRLYSSQGTPDLGRVPTLSKSDVVQLNRLYNCQGSGVPGKLTVNVKMAQNLQRQDNPYVIVSAIDDRGRNVTKTTNHLIREPNPRWNAKLRFGSRPNWQYVEVSIWNHNDKKDTQLTPSQIFSINPGRQALEHCEDVLCTKKMTFSTSLTEDCHCQNGGSCLASKSCSCVVGYGGAQCQYRRGRLRITVNEASNLISADAPGRSDPYVVIHAYDHNGNITTQQTTVFNNNNNPQWNEHLHFHANDWGWFTVQVMDQDSRNQITDDRLSFAQTFVLNSFESVNRQEMDAFGTGTLTFSYQFEQ